MTVQQFDFIINVTKVLIWQYNDAEKLQHIIQDKQNWLDANMRDFWQSWFDDIYNLDTANSFGLQVWSIILGVSFSTRELTPTAIFNFDGSGAENFENGNFLPSGDGTILNDEQKRLILKLRYRQMTSNATIDEMQRAISDIIPGAKMIDVLDMSVTVTYPDPFDSLTSYILDNYDVIPRPAAVKLNYLTGYGSWFGFDSLEVQNFYYPTFGA